MYKVEWDKIESALMERLADRIEQLQYVGQICDSIPELKSIEKYNNGKYWTYSDLDYNHNATLAFWVLVKDKRDISQCYEEIHDILENIGYNVISDPFCRDENNGAITLVIKFYRNISMDKVIWGDLTVDKDEKG